MMLNIFSCTSGYLYILFGEIFIQFLCSFFFLLLLNFKSSIFQTFISELYHLKYFLPLCRLYFHFLDMQKLFILIQPNSSIFSFVSCAFGVLSMNFWPNPRSWRFNFVFSHKSSMGLALKSSIHFTKLVHLFKTVLAITAFQVAQW